MLQCSALCCEYLENPVGIDEPFPRFCWKLESDRENVLQTAYEIKVDGMWESGKVKSGESVHIVYGGAPLKPFTRYHWAVRVWDNQEQVSDWAQGYFETGLMDSKNWVAKWIAAEEEKDEVLPVFQKRFSLESSAAAARIYATALGIYEITLNGQRVGDRWLAPGFTSYNKHLLYQTYDVTPLLQQENVLCITLAKGWCRGRLGWNEGRNLFECEPGILAQLRVEQEDGTVQTIVTDETWQWSQGPYRISEIYDGETYDARLEDDTKRDWQPVRLIEYPFSHISAQTHEPVRITEQLQPVQILKTPKGETVVDFGQNMVGWAQVRVQGQRGDRVLLSFGEVLDKDGNFYNANYRTAKNRVEYILKGSGEECWHPHFTFQGFRYVRVEDFPCEITLAHFTGIVIHSDMKRTGTFSCGNAQINQLFQNTIWGQRGNFVDVPTDCPQRDERLGWTGDAQVFIKTAALNYGVTPFFEKWLTDLKLDQRQDGSVPDVIPKIVTEGQSSAWGDAATICPWEIYCAYGDKRILEQQYDSMRAWVDYIREQGEEEYLWNTGFHYGDWLALDAAEGDYIGRTATDFIATAFFAHSADLVSKAAAILGKTEDVKIYQDLYSNIRRCFQAEFVTPRGRLTEDTQTAYVLALHFDLVENRGRAIRRLTELVRENGCKLTTGFVGTPYLCHALTDNGQEALAYSLVLQTEYPSWLFSVCQGATTIWEHWDGIKPDGSFWSTDMNSYNHYAYGSIVDWMYTKAAGIRYDETAPGYQKILFHPVPDKRFGYVEAKVDTVYGVVKSAWRYEGDNVHFTVTVPHNATAVFEAPDGRKIELGSGTHQI